MKRNLTVELSGAVIDSLKIEAIRQGIPLKELVGLIIADWQLTKANKETV